jgi:hypothetical protein
MGMKSINLIPAPRRAARRRKLHLRRCTIGCAVWGVLSLAAAGAAQAIWRGDEPQADERLAKVGEEMRRTEAAIAAVRQQLTAAQSTLRANQGIASQPDWSILLALLGKTISPDRPGEETVLKSCVVRPAHLPRGQATPRTDPRRPAAQAPAEPAVSNAVPYVLEASGMARSHAAANEFVLRLEKTGLFSKVTLLDTARESFLDKDAIAFRIECALDQRPLKNNPAAGTGAASARGGD